MDDCEDTDTASETDEENDDRDRIRFFRGDEDYDSGVNTDMSLATTVAPSSPLLHHPLRRSPSTKILQIINLLQQDATKYDSVVQLTILTLFLSARNTFFLNFVTISHNM